MSKENRPNLNAVGLLVDIQNAVQNRIRGKAKQAGNGDILVLTHNIFLPAIEKLDKELDEKYGV